ncbi:hypothetical protein D3C81_1157900 [compost metagenome]
MQLAWLDPHPWCLRPLPGQAVDHLTDAAHVAFARAEVPRTGARRPLGVKALGQLQVAGQRFQGVLPGAHSLRVAQGDRRPGRPSLEHIGDKPLCGKVSAAQYIAGARSGQGHAMFGVFGGREE